MNNTEKIELRTALPYLVVSTVGVLVTFVVAGWQGLHGYLDWWPDVPAGIALAAAVAGLVAIGRGR